MVFNITGMRNHDFGVRKHRKKAEAFHQSLQFMRDKKGGSSQRMTSVRKTLDSEQDPPSTSFASYFSEIILIGDVNGKRNPIYISDSLGKSQQHVAKRTTTASNKPVHYADISDVDYGTTVSDDDMENDLVDIQPFETSDTTSEVFVNTSFVSQRNPEQHVSVSVLTLSQLPENAEHSTEYVPDLRTPCERVPPSDQEIVVLSTPCDATQIRKESSNSFDQLNPVDINPMQAFSPLGDQNCASTFDDRSESSITAANEDHSIMDETNQMEPPVLDGPIIVSQCEVKSTTEMPPTLMADGIEQKEPPKPIHYVVGEIYRVHTPNGTEQEVQLAVMDDGSEALVNVNGEIIDMTPEDGYATIDICDIDFNFLDDKNIVCGLCGEVVLYSSLFNGHFSRVHPELYTDFHYLFQMLDADMLIGGVPYVEYLKTKFSKQSVFRRTPRRVSQIRINPTEMSMAQLEVALKKKLLEKMGRKFSFTSYRSVRFRSIKSKLQVSVSLVDKEHVKCGICNSVISINKKFELFFILKQTIGIHAYILIQIVHVVRHFNAWHPTNHQCAGQWQKRTQKPGLGKPLSKQDFAVIDLSHTQPDNLQCIWCGMFIDATTIAVHFTDCHPGEVEVPKCLLCIQELVINARIIEKFGSDFDVILPDEFHIKVEKLNKLFTSESQMDNVSLCNFQNDVAIERYLDTLNGKRKKAPLTVERRVFDGDSVVVHTTAIPGEEVAVDDVDEVIARPRPTNAFRPIVVKFLVDITNRNGVWSSRFIGAFFKVSFCELQYVKHFSQAPPTNSDYVKVISDSHWKCKICDADLYGAVISACAYCLVVLFYVSAIRHFKLKHPQESDSLQFEVVRARLDRISDGCMEFVHPQMLECLICHLTYQLHKPYNVCRGIRHLKSRHPEIMPEFNGEPLRRYRKTGTALRLDDDPNIPRRRKDARMPVDNDLLARLKAQYPNSFDKVQTIYGTAGEPMYVLMSESNEADEVVKENMKLMSNVSAFEPEKSAEAEEGNGEEISSDDIKPRQEVVFELSYDYNNLDAEGKPRKHLVRVTPGMQNKLPLSSDTCARYIMENESSVSIPEAQLEHNEVRKHDANEVFFDEGAQGEENSTDETTVILGDVLFIDADGNEIIQRTTALQDGTVQQQYLGQAENGSFFVLGDAVSAGLHPCADVVDVYEEELVNDSAESQNLILQEGYENQVGNVANHLNQGNNRNGHRGHSEISEGQEFDASNTVIVGEAYSDDRAVLVEEFSDCVEIGEAQPKYSRKVVIGDNVQYDEGEVASNEEVFRERLVTRDERFDRGATEVGHSTTSGCQQNVSEQNTSTVVKNR
uniref:C2H2-type domain-containing protein n=1 Tax=Angiostrongylus costaricensis TaxID=334426 RepID=A0A158PGM7_ANGCS